jgi:seryl-tRNA synthetase
MLDSEFLNDPKKILQLLESRMEGERYFTKMADDLAKAISNRRTWVTELQSWQTRHKEFSGKFAARLANGEALADLQEVAAYHKEMMRIVSEKVDTAERELLDLASLIPNIPADDVPIGWDNSLLYTEGACPDLSVVRDHVDLGQMLDMMELEKTVEMSGARFITLQGPLAKFHRVLANWMVEHGVDRGYVETAPPHIVKKHAMYGTGQLPKFEEDLYEANGRYFIPTAEVSLTNLVANSIIEDTAPIRMVAHTPCYRLEAGSAGREVRGLIRQHQFNKVELVSVCRPEDAEREHRRMVDSAVDILRQLGLPFRKILLSSKDMGFSARKTYDLEVWIPSQNTYREISSISDCGDFQARRMNARYRQRDGSLAFLNTLNGSSLAVGRTLVAIMENYQEPNGSIRIPTVLQKDMGGSLITSEGVVYA